MLYVNYISIKMISKLYILLAHFSIRVLLFFSFAYFY